MTANIVKDEKLISCPAPRPNAKVNQITVRKTKKTQKSDEKIEATLGAFVDTMYQKPCVISDELYFGMSLKKKPNYF